MFTPIRTDFITLTLMGQVPMTGEATKGLKRQNDLMTCVIPRLLSSVRKEFFGFFGFHFTRTRFPRTVGIFILLVLTTPQRSENRGSDS